MLVKGNSIILHVFPSNLTVDLDEEDKLTLKLQNRI